MRKNPLPHWIRCFLAGALVALVSPEPGSAAEPPPGRPTPPATRPERGGQESRERTVYSLSEQQLRLFQEALRKDRAELARLGESYRLASNELIEATLAENFSELDVRAKAEALGKVHAEMMTLRARALSAVSPTLEPEQRAQLIERFGMEILYGRADGRPRGDENRDRGGRR